MRVLLLIALLLSVVLSYSVDVCPSTLEELCIGDINNGKQ